MGVVELRELRESTIIPHEKLRLISRWPVFDKSEAHINLLPRSRDKLLFEGSQKKLEATKWLRIDHSLQRATSAILDGTRNGCLFSVLNFTTLKPLSPQLLDVYTYSA